jgi:hypothetical protein
MKVEEHVSGDEGIDLSVFDDKYLRVEVDEPVDVTLTNWRRITKEFDGQPKDGLRFDVVEENKEPVKKEMDAVGWTFPRALAPLIRNAEKDGKKTIRCRITKTGSGKTTKYSIKTLEDRESVGQ